MPPCSGYFFASTETASASGTKKASQASTHSSTDGAPARAPREIQRRPVTATTVKKTMSQRPRTRCSSGRGAADFRRGSSGGLLDVVLEGGQRARSSRCAISS